MANPDALHKGNHGGKRMLWGCGIALPMALVTALASISVIGTVWSRCDVGSNGSANGFGLLFFVFPLAFLVHLAVFGLTFPFALAGATRPSRTYSPSSKRRPLGPLSR